MSKKIKNNQKPILVILLAAVFVTLLFIPLEKAGATDIPGISGPGPGGYRTCYCMAIPWSCGCNYWR